MVLFYFFVYMYVVFIFVLWVGGGVVNEIVNLYFFLLNLLEICKEMFCK